MQNVFTVHNKIALLDKVIKKSDVVLDIGFWGQGITYTSPAWPHKQLKDRAADVYGIDIIFDESIIPIQPRKQDTRQSQCVPSRPHLDQQSICIVLLGL